VEDDFSVDSETLLMTDFVNLKIKPAQSFRGAHRGMMYVRVFIEIIDRTCMSICVSQKQEKNGGNNHWKTVNRDLSKGGENGITNSRIHRTDLQVTTQGFRWVTTNG
jgi:hypothetical protein